jgi:hypothetical protein
MNMKSLFLLLPALTLLLAACSTTVAPGGRTRIETDGVTITTDPDHGHHPHGQRFCPPGQAKKGRC